jgi:hypothetical protein
MRTSIAAARRKTAVRDRESTGKYPVVKGEGPAPLILLVDDSEDDREMYGACFLHGGFRVEHAVDGEPLSR